MPDALATLDPLVLRLLDRGLLRGTFTLRSGAVSDRYFDKYRVSCEPELLREVARAMAARVAALDHRPTRIVAPELGAVPIAAALALEADIPFAIVRATAKEHGPSNRIEGATEAGELAVLVEDVVTSGGAALDALEAARGVGLIVQDALCLLDRDAGGADSLARAGVALHPLIEAGQLDHAFRAGVGTQVRP